MPVRDRYFQQSTAPGCDDYQAGRRSPYHARTGIMRAFVEMVGRCNHCNTELHFQQYHAGFGDQGYMYCDQDSTVVTWSSYDPTYSSLSDRTHPWVLDDDAKRRVEDAIIECPHGGRFRFDALPRCPHCGTELPD